MRPERPPSDCVDDAAATAFVEGLLSAEEVGRIEGHIDQCAECRQHLVVLVRARTGAGPAQRDDRRLLAGGTVLGRYQILRVVGLGSMGVVYAAHDSQLERTIALKFVRAQANQDGLLREAHALARLRHLNVVTVHDIGTAGDRVFIAMELIDGTTLSQHLREPRARRAVVELFVQAARGLHAAHTAGLVHRDFKPDNVLVDSDGRVCVTDFGLARRAEAPAEPEVAATNGSPPPTVTRSDVVVGTPAYMAPEQHLGRAADARSDQFAFCVALYEALYGVRPFAGRDLRELHDNVTTGAMIRTPRGRGVPRVLAKIVERGLAIAPDERYPSLAALADELEKTRRSRRPLLAAAVAMMAVAVSVLWATRPSASSCEASAGLVDEVWGPAQRGAQIARFTALRPRELAMIQSSVRLVDDWAAAWKLDRRTACAADRQQRVVRLGCLDHQLAELRAQVAVWRAADAEVVDRAFGAAAALPAPSACATQVAPPIDRDTSERIARLRALDRAGQHKQANEELPVLLANVEKSTNPAAVAAALVTVARIEFLVGDNDKAREHHSRAAREAAAASDDATLFAAMIGEAAVIVEQGRALDALGLISAAEALAIRAKLDRAEVVARARGAALTAAGKQREAIVELQRALSFVVTRAGREPSARADIALVLGAIAAAEIQQYHYAEAHELLKRVLELEQSIYGAEHPELAKTLHDLGTTAARLGRYEEALARLERARAMFVAAYGERHVTVGGADISIGNALVQQGKPEDARPYFTRAWQMLSTLLPEGSALLITAEQTLAVLIDRVGSCEESIPHHQHVIAMLERNGRGGPDLANEQINLAACLADVGRLAEARAAVDAGIAGMDAAGVSPLDHCQPWMVQADVAWREGNKAQAIALWRKILATSKGVDRPDIVQVRNYVQKTLADATK
jgi:tetratricopeptide (TPR) repeat protein/predicted Ser/Thr protein kinase